MKFRYLILLIFVVFISCGGEKLPKGVLDREKMVNVLVDIHLSDAISAQRYSLGMVRDSLQEDLYLSICRKHEVEPKVLENSLYFYGRHPELFKKVYDAAVDRLNEMDIEAKKDSLPDVIPPAMGDTIRTSGQQLPADSASKAALPDTLSKE